MDAELHGWQHPIDRMLEGDRPEERYESFKELVEAEGATGRWDGNVEN